MEFLFFFGALGLGLAAVFGPEVRVCLRHRRRERMTAEALRRRALRQVLRNAARMTREPR